MQTKRNILRPWQISDAEALYKYASDPDIGTRAGWPPHKSMEESLEIIRTVFNNDTTWAIVLKGTGEAIGAMGYMPDCPLNLPARKGEPLVGYWVGKPYWNQGICTEALQLMIDFIRKETSYASLICSHFVDNPASGRVMEKCGFVPTGETAINEETEFGQEHPMRVLRLELNNKQTYSNGAQKIVLRPFVYEDAATILSWCKDKRAFRLWSADRYKDFPASPDEMFQQYEGGGKYPLTMMKGGRIVGHILLRYPSADTGIVRIGFVIVDDALRSKGYGKMLLQMAINHAKSHLMARKITLGVFNDNIQAIMCYKSVGFHIVSTDTYIIDGEEWKGVEMELTNT